jgi:ribosomal-protein-alanine N-acetyltransferase
MKPWGRSSISTRRAEISDCVVLAEIHASAFKRGWSDAEFEALLLQPGVHALVAHYRNALGRRIPAGFILYRSAADEAEILSVAVMPSFRRRGVGKALIEDALRHLYREGARTIHLEVEDSNAAAIGLYRGVEFRESGRRAGYYAQGRETAAGALVMLRQLR